MMYFNKTNEKQLIKGIQDLKKKYESKLAKYDAYFTHNLSFYPIKLDGTIYEDSEYFAIPLIVVKVGCDARNMNAMITWDNETDNISCKTYYPNETTTDGEMFKIVDSIEKIIECENLFDSFINNLKFLAE